MTKVIRTMYFRPTKSPSAPKARTKKPAAEGQQREDVARGFGAKRPS